MRAVPLSNATLATIDTSIAVPTYDRSALTAGIVHIGVGNFHRAHMGWYQHRLFQTGATHDWAIIGAGVRLSDRTMRSKLAPQDWMTTLIELGPRRIAVEITGAMIDFIAVGDGNGTMIDRMVDPTIRIVSMTVTEGGYFIDPATRRFDPNHPDIRHDIAHPDSPRTAFGAIVAALGRRREIGARPFTGLSCDNLRGNGEILRQCVVGLAALTDPGLADWIDEHGAFPNSMVDCITPATGPDEIALARSLGVADSAPVTHEGFRQWVIEDDFCAGRPPWEETGATFTNDVTPFEERKILILNGGHQIIAAAGDLLGKVTIAEAVSDPSIRAFLHKVVSLEISPHVDTPEANAAIGSTAAEYFELIERRFSNTNLVDTTRRVAFDGANRHAEFIVPSIKRALDTHGRIDGLALVSAIWARYCVGVREDGSVIAANDPRWDELSARAKIARADPSAWLDMPDVYGNLRDSAAFATRFSQWMRVVRENGVAAAMAEYAGAV